MSEPQFFAKENPSNQWIVVRGDFSGMIGKIIELYQVTRRTCPRLTQSIDQFYVSSTPRVTLLCKAVEITVQLDDIEPYTPVATTWDSEAV